jgi:hypothetical protein
MFTEIGLQFNYVHNSLLDHDGIQRWLLIGHFGSSCILVRINPWRDGSRIKNPICFFGSLAYLPVPRTGRSFGAAPFRNNDGGSMGGN